MAMRKSLSSLIDMFSSADVLTQNALQRATADVCDSKGRPANYASLCDRVNRLGAQLAEIKTDYQILVRDKAELSRILEELRSLDQIELQKLTPHLQQQQSIQEQNLPSERSTDS